MPSEPKTPDASTLVRAVSQDQPSPLDAFFGYRIEGTHATPYEELTVRKGLRLFDVMPEIDETVSYGLETKIRTRLATGWSIQDAVDANGEEMKGAEEVGDFIRDVVAQTPDFRRFLEQMMDGLRQGFKLAEIITKDGKANGRKGWILDDLVVRNSRFFAFETDKAGRKIQVKEYVSDGDTGIDTSGWVSYWDESTVKRHDYARFVHWANRPRDGNAYSLYGRSDLLPVYRAWFLKDVLLKAWGETLDTYKSPIALGIARAGLTQTQKTDYLNNVIRAAQRKGFVLPEEYIPAGMDPEKALRFHEVTGKAGDFEAAVAYCDKVMLRGLMLGSLVADVGQEGRGSYALGQTHMGAFLTVLDDLGISVGSAITRTLFRKVVVWNFGPEAARLTPSLRFPAAGDNQTVVRSQIVRELVGSGIVDAREPWVREWLGDLPAMPEDIADLREQERTEDRANAAAKAKQPPAKGEKMAATDPPAGPTSPLRRTPTPVEEKVDWMGVVAGAREREGQFARKVNEAWARVFDGKGGLAARSRIALSKPEAVPSFDIDPTPMVDAFFSFAVAGMVSGAVDGWREVNKGRRFRGQDALDLTALSVSTFAPFDEAGVVSLAEIAARYGVDLDAQTEALAKTIRISQAELDAFARARMAEVRAQVEQQVARLKAQVTTAVQNAKGQGTAAKAFQRGALADLRDKWVGIEADLANENSALFRTLESSAYNEGRFRLYQQAGPGIVQGYLYSAIIDPATTAFCRAWDGFEAPADDPVWRKVTPPNHYNCRSVLVAVLVGEVEPGELREKAKSKPSEAPQAGFEGVRFIPGGLE